jgi:hypothetical protein
VKKKQKRVELNQVVKAVVKEIREVSSSYKIFVLFVTIILLAATGYFVG